jgi:hypothetical protein
MGMGLAIQKYIKPLISLIIALQHNLNMVMAGRTVNNIFVRCTICISHSHYCRFSGLFNSDGLLAQRAACVDVVPDR